MRNPREFFGSLIPEHTAIIYYPTRSSEFKSITYLKLLSSKEMELFFLDSSYCYLFVGKETGISQSLFIRMRHDSLKDRKKLKTRSEGGEKVGC